MDRVGGMQEGVVKCRVGGVKVVGRGTNNGGGIGRQADQQQKLYLFNSLNPNPLPCPCMMARLIQIIAKDSNKTTLSLPPKS